MAELDQARRDLVIANHILAHQNVVDAYGHVSIRHPARPDHFLLARSRSPELVTEADIMEFALDSKVIGWTPDVGHIINGGMDPLETMRQYADLINHIHYKDWDGAPEFAVMGEGKVAFSAITCWLRDRGFNGWIICEDEGHRAIEDPDGVTLADGAYVRKNLEPLCQS